MTLVERLKRKFISHNSVPISSIRISREEFDEIEQRIDELEIALALTFEQVYDNPAIDALVERALTTQDT